MFSPNARLILLDRYTSVTEKFGYLIACGLQNIWRFMPEKSLDTDFIRFAGCFQIVKQLVCVYSDVAEFSLRVLSLLTNCYHVMIK